jgi:hypothetical protein
LNRLTSILLDIFEDQLDIGRLVVMADAKALLDQQLRSLNRAVLVGGGHVKMTDAKKRAENQYEIYNANRKAERRKDADRVICELKQVDKTLPKPKRPKL